MPENVQVLKHFNDVLHWQYKNLTSCINDLFGNDTIVFTRLKL